MVFECGVSDRSGFYLEWTEVDPAGRRGKIHLKEYIEQIGNVIRDPVVRMFLLTEIATGVYGTILRFIPLLAIAREIEISVFLKYTAVFTVINCICSLFLTLITDRLDKKWVYLLMWALISYRLRCF